MTGTLQTSVIKNPTSSANNLSLGTDGSVTVNGNLSVTGSISNLGTINSITPTGGTLTINGGVTATGTLAGGTGPVFPLLSSAVSTPTSGTSVLFTSVPAWVKRITVMLSQVNFTDPTTPVPSIYLGIQIGNSGIQTSGYLSYAAQITGTGSVNSLTGSNCFLLTTLVGPANISGVATMSLVTGSPLGDNIWNYTSTMQGPVFAGFHTATGTSPTFTGALDRFRVILFNTTASTNFISGKLSYLYE
jgi:hypothetical protein